jgi:CRP-like cAMP-binding protein/1-acyl-sn-glycerol-3-phosphate acyltransferase
MFMKSFLKLLRESPFFESFPDEDLSALAAHAGLRSVEAGRPILREDAPADRLYMLVVGKIQLSFEAGPQEVEGATTDKVHIRTITEPGRVIGWSAIVEPHRYRDTAMAIEDTQLLSFDRGWLEKRAEQSPEFGFNLMSRILWVLGNRLREARVRLVVSRYEQETLAIRALLEQSRAQLSVTSPLHKLPIYLENRLTLGDAFQTLELLRVHGEPLEASLARICLEILVNVRRELDLYRRLQNIYEHVSGAPEEASPGEIRRRCCTEFNRLFGTMHYMIEGLENLPDGPGHIFIMNHLADHPENTLPNDFQLTLDTHFVSSMILAKKYGESPIRVVRMSGPDEIGHQRRYFDRLGYILVQAQHMDDSEGNPKFLPQQRRRHFLETAASCLSKGRNLVICPEGACTITEQSPLPFKAGAFRLAAYCAPEPLLIPIIVANFDRKITRTTLIARVQPPVRLSEHVPKPIVDQQLFAFIDGLNGQYRRWVQEAQVLAADNPPPT